MIPDSDATDDPVNDHPEGRFFNGYHDHYCILAPYVFHEAAGGLPWRSNIDAYKHL